jgi:hypothetical protein
LKNATNDMPQNSDHHVLTPFEKTDSSALESGRSRQWEKRKKYSQFADLRWKAGERHNENRVLGAMVW